MLVRTGSSYSKLIATQIRWVVVVAGILGMVCYTFLCNLFPFCECTLTRPCKKTSCFLRLPWGCTLFFALQYPDCLRRLHATSCACLVFELPVHPRVPEYSKVLANPPENKPIPVLQSSVTWQGSPDRAHKGTEASIGLMEYS